MNVKRLFSISEETSKLIDKIASEKRWDFSTVIEESVSLYAQDNGYTSQATEAEQAQPGVDYDPNGSMCEDDYNYFKKAVQK